mmetsp:Transcript_9769/g.8349  ORF Transcript_9769/g.8349 Transcript_9769/m.8349 type:complete len:193 (+) Transcript_9769:83-661(+)
MKARIEELEDILYEHKQKEGARRVVELTDIVSDLEKRLDRQGKNVEELKQRIVDYQAGSNNQDQNAIDFFSKLLEDKDQKLNYLQRQNEMLQSKEKQLLVENDKLKENLKQINVQFENYKARQSKFDDIASMRMNSGTMSDARRDIQTASPLQGLRYNEAVLDVGGGNQYGSGVIDDHNKYKESSATDTYLK